MLILRPFGPTVITTQYVHDDAQRDGDDRPLCIGQIIKFDGDWKFRPADGMDDLPSATLRELADLMDGNR